MMNLTKFPSFLVLIMITPSVFSEEIFLDCILDPKIYEMDINLDNRSGKWVPYSSNIFTEDASDPQYRLSIDQNRVRFGKTPFDYIEIDLNTLMAKAVLSIGMGADGMGAGSMGADGMGAGSMGADGMGAGSMGAECMGAICLNGYCKIRNN